MSERPVRQEKGEKDEKEEEKNQGKEEKSWEEKWRRDPLNTAVWASIFIWAGLVFLADNLDLLHAFGHPEAWALILLGAGVIVLVEVFLRLMVPAYRRPIIGSLILGLVLVSIGLQDLIHRDIIWALGLIALGVAILVSGFFRRS